MKKILLILLLIPTFVQAEELGLICDGKTKKYVLETKQTTSKKSSEDVVITDTYLRYRSLKYYKGTDFDRDTKAEYFAHYDGVSFSTYIKIDRFTGKIIATVSYHKENSTRTFEGVCRKKEKAF